MGISKLITIASMLTVLAASTGGLPKIIKAVHIAQLYLIKDSQSSTWGRAMLLPVTK